MDHSYAESIGLGCSSCGSEYEATVWLIVDVLERPDLAAKISDGTIYDVLCPHCKAVGQMDAPLLVFQPGAVEQQAEMAMELSPVVFSPAGQKSVEEDQAQAQALIDVLRERLGSDWREVWVESARSSVPRSLLRAALTNDVGRLAAAFIGARGSTQARRLVERYPVLMGRETDVMFRRLLEDEPQPKARLVLEEQRTLLLRCRQVGVVRAFAARLSPELEQIFRELDQLTGIAEMPQRVLLCNQALTRLSREEESEYWAAAQAELGKSLSQNPLGDRAGDMEQALLACQRSLEVRTRQVMPIQWAASMHNLGLAYFERIAGDRAENLEQAIAASEQALEVFTPHGLPGDWAAATLNMATMFQERICGDRAENLERAIDAYQQVLEVYTLQEMPANWAAATQNLGIAYSQRICGDRAENLERAIDAYQQALEVRTRAAMPVDWAATMHNLGETYLQRIRSDTGENQEQAINAFQQALEIRTRQALPLAWADTMISLGNAYRVRIRGDRAENLERAIGAYEQALEVRTRDAMPVGWAHAKNNLGNAYAERIRGDRAENLEGAVDAFQRALEVLTFEAVPLDWATVMNGLANAYRERIRGDSAENLEKAIDACQQALEVRTRDAMPVGWADAMISLGNAYRVRIRGDRAENLEKAIDACQQALEVITRAAMPVGWADAMISLGTAYIERIRGDRAENLECAIGAYEQALEVITRAAMPDDWATAMNNLGVAYRERSRGDRAENVEQAIAVYQQVLEVRTRDAMPVAWATAMNNLGIAYTERIGGDRAENLEQAIDTYQQTLEIITRAAKPTYWATALNNLGIAYEDRIRGDKAENQELAIAAYEQSLEVYTPETLPVDCRRTASLLGDLRYGRREWRAARAAYEQSAQAADLLHRSARIEQGKLQMAEDNATLYARLVHCDLLLGDWEAAFTHATSAQGRIAIDLLASAQIDLTNLPEDLGKRVQAAQELKDQQDALWQQRSSQTLLPMAQALTEQIAELRRQEDDAWEGIRWEYPDYFATQAAEAFTVPDARALAKRLDTTLVAYYRHAGGWVAFVVRPEHEGVVAVDLALTDRQLADWLMRFTDRLDRRPRNNVRRLDDLYQALIAPLAEQLPKADPAHPSRLVLAPFGMLHLVPLTALRSPSGRYLGEEYALAVTPSLAVLKRMVARAEGRRLRSKLCSVAYPGDEGSPHYLPHVLPEVQGIGQGFESTVTLWNEAASPAAVLAQGPGVHVAHYACHAAFDLAHVEQSGLLLAGGWLRVRDIFNELRLPDANLAVLSACQTGLAQMRSGDELTGLVQAFLYAGAPAVVASQWSVSDAATRYLFERFYCYYTAGISASEALRSAQQDMRQKGYDHPYWWAAFQPLGAVYEALPVAEWPVCAMEIPTYDERKRGGSMEPPTPMEILHDAQMLLNKMAADAKVVAELLAPDEQASMRARLGELQAQASAVTTDEDLLALADGVVRMVEGVPALCDEFLGDVDPQAEQKARELSLEAYDKKQQALTDSEDQRRSIANTMHTYIRRITGILLESKDNRL